MSEDQPELPASWAWVGIEQIGQPDRAAIKAGPFGSALKKESYCPSGYKIYGQEQVIADDCHVGEYFIDEAKFRQLESCAVKPGDVLISLVGSYGHITIVPEDALPGIINPRLIRLSFNPNLIESRFFKHYFESPVALAQLESRVHGGTMGVLNASDLRELKLPLPPLPEQRRIVEKVEAVLADVSAARERLAKVPLILKRFRQAVLAAACSGRLTEEWRDEHPLPNAGKRLHSLATARERLWSKIVSQRTGSDNSRLRYKAGFEAATPDGLELPATWDWATVSQVALLDVGNAFKSVDFKDVGIPLLRGENVEPGALRWTETRCWPPTKLRGLEHLLIEEGDIILAMDRPIISSGLKLAVAKASDVPCLLVQRVMRLRCVERETGAWLRCCLLEPRFAAFLGHEGMTGSDLPHITGTGVAEFPVPLPPLQEQAEILRRVEALFAVADAIEERVKVAITRANKLPQAILSKAFRGELVPTEAELARAEGRRYETPHEMLTRVKGASETAAPRKPTPRRPGVRAKTAPI